MNYKKFVIKLFKRAGVEINGPNPWDIRVHDDSFYKRIFFDRSLGFGEAYSEGLFDCDRLDLVYFKFIKAGLHEERNFSFLDKILSRLFNLQNLKLSVENVKRHYDLGNDLYKSFLDTRMVYSCGYWKNTDNLDQAQIDKFDLICRKLDLKKGQRILEIGCGWGGFAIYAARKYGVSVVGVTLSTEQYNLALELTADIPEVEIRFQDYREIPDDEKYDHVVSIGMFEHVGLKNHETFFKKVHSLLKDDSRDGVEHLFLLHTIGCNVSDTRTDPWIEKYIFPGGFVPSARHITNAVENLFVIEDWHNFGFDYSKTLQAWYKKFVLNKDKLPPVYNEYFKRMWSFYLLTAAGSFMARYNQLWQIVLSKKGILGTYNAPR